MNTAIRPTPFSAPARNATSGAAREPSWISKAGGAVWRAFEASGEARARRHILDFANRCESLQPDLAKELRALSHGSRD